MEAYTQSPRKFDSDFKSRYSNDKFNYEGTDVVGSTKKGSGNYEAYKNGDPEIEEDNNTEGFDFDFSYINIIFYFALIIAIIFLAYLLINEGQPGLFNSKKSKKIDSDEAITAENIENTDINALITNAETNNDYRLAIRFYYLLVLKNMSLKKLIKFEDDKTNSEYLNELYNTPYSKDFSYGSYLYNYIWYGEFPISTEQYTRAKIHFTNLLNLVK